MKVFKIDLYEYFNIPKKDGAKGILTCYIKSDAVYRQDIEILKPAVLVIAGGGYYSVSDREKEPVALKFLASGYNAFCLEYSIYPNHFPTPLIEACMAMVYLRKNANDLLIDKDKICAIGFSAGGHLLGMLSNLNTHESVEFLKEYNEQICPNACIFAYPVVSGVDKPHISSFAHLFGEENYKENAEMVSIEKLVSKNSPPAFIFSTFNDQVVPVKNSLLLASAYEEMGIPFSLHIFKSGRHGLSLGDETVYFNGDLNGESGVIKSTSKNFYEWFSLAINFLKELGFCKKEVLK